MLSRWSRTSSYEFFSLKSSVFSALDSLWETSRSDWHSSYFCFHSAKTWQEAAHVISVALWWYKWGHVSKQKDPPCRNSSVSCLRWHLLRLTFLAQPWDPRPPPAASAWSSPAMHTWHLLPLSSPRTPAAAGPASSFEPNINCIKAEEAHQRWPEKHTVRFFTLPPRAPRCAGWCLSRIYFSTEPRHCSPWTGSAAAQLWPLAPPRTALLRARSRDEMTANCEPRRFLSKEISKHTQKNCFTEMQ